MNYSYPCLCVSVVQNPDFAGPCSPRELRDFDRHDPLRAWAAPAPVDLDRAERILRAACHPNLRIIRTENE